MSTFFHFKVSAKHDTCSPGVRQRSILKQPKPRLGPDLREEHARLWGSGESFQLISHSSITHSTFILRYWFGSFLYFVFLTVTGSLASLLYHHVSSYLCLYLSHPFCPFIALVRWHLTTFFVVFIWSSLLGNVFRFVFFFRFCLSLVCKRFTGARS